MPSQKRIFLLFIVFAAFGIGAFWASQAQAKDGKVRTGTIQQDVKSAASSSLFLFSPQTPGMTLKTASNGYEQSRTLFSESFKTDFRFNAIGLHYDASVPVGTDIRFEVRFKEVFGWSEWQSVEPQNDLKEETTGFFSEPLFVDGEKTFQYKMILTTTNTKITPTINDIEWIYLDSSGGKFSQVKNWIEKISQRIKRSHEARAAEGVKVITRAEWGADESYRLKADGTELWPAKKEAVKKFIVHHTAGTSGKPDSAATIRGIYYWHAQVLGWGDIGYNYLIDQDGNIYEGRYGGDGVIGGHTYNSQTKTNYNVGSTGMAVLGCFETTEGACAQKHESSELIRKAITDLIAEKATLWKIAPAESSEWFGTLIPNIVGHRDVDKTYCPGSILHAELETIRQKSQEKYVASEVAIPELRAEFTESNIPETIFLNDQWNVTVKIKNTGLNTWNKDTTFLDLYDTGFAESRFRHAEWTDAKGHFSFQEEKVDTDQTATFIFKLRAPKDLGTFTHVIQLTANSTETSGGQLQKNTRVDSHYKAKLSSHTIRKAMKTGWKPKVTVKIKNTGHAPWTRGMVLDVTAATNQPSPFSHSSWPDKKYGGFTVKERKVETGQTGTFEFLLKAPQKTGTYPLQFDLHLKNKTSVVEGGKFSFTIRVDQ